MVENKAKHGKVKVCCERNEGGGMEMVQGIPRQEHERGQIKRGESTGRGTESGLVSRNTGVNHDFITDNFTRSGARRRRRQRSSSCRLP